MPAHHFPPLNSGRKDAKGRTIWIAKGGAGQPFVKTASGGRSKPATGAAPRQHAAPTQSGRSNALGRPIWISPKAREYVILTSKKTGKQYHGKPATRGALGHATATAFTNIHGRTIHAGPLGGMYVHDHAGRKRRIATRNGAHALSW